MKIIDLEEKDIQQEPGTESHTEGTEAIRFGELASFFTGLWGSGVPGLNFVGNNILHSGIYLLQNNKIKKALDSTNEPLEVSNDDIKAVQTALDKRSNRKIFVEEFSKILEKDGNKSWKYTNFVARLNSSSIKYAAKLIKNKKGDNLVLHTAIPVANIPKMINRWLDNQGLDYTNLPEPFTKYNGKAKTPTELILAYLTDISNQAIAKVPEWANAPIPVFAAAISPLYIAIMTPKIKAESVAKNEGSESVSDLDLLESIFESEALESENTLEYLLNLHKDMGFENVNDIAKMIKCEFNDEILEKIYSGAESNYYDDILPEVAIESIEEIIEMEGTEGLVKWVKGIGEKIKSRRVAKRIIDISQDEKDKFASEANAKFTKLLKSAVDEVGGKLKLVDGKTQVEWRDSKYLVLIIPAGFEGKEGASGEELNEDLKKIYEALDKKLDQMPKLDKADFWDIEHQGGTVNEMILDLHYSGTFKSE